MYIIEIEVLTTTTQFPYKPGTKLYVSSDVLGKHATTKLLAKEFINLSDVVDGIKSFAGHVNVGASIAPIINLQILHDGTPVASPSINNDITVINL